MIICVRIVVPVDFGLGNERLQEKTVLNGEQFVIDLFQSRGVSVLQNPKPQVDFKSIKELKIASCDRNGKSLSYVVSQRVEDEKRERRVFVYPDSDAFLETVIEDKVLLFANILFEDAVSNADQVKEKCESFIQKSNAVLRKVIDSYRWATSYNSAKRMGLPPSPASLVFACVKQPEMPLERYDEVELEFLTCEIALKEHEDIEIAPERMTDLEYRRFESILGGCDDIPLDISMLLEAKELAFFNKAYDMAVVLLDMSLEVKLRELLKGSCCSRGIRQLTHNKKSTGYNDAISKARIDTCLKAYAKQIIQHSLADNAAYNRWHTLCHTKRNEVVHRGVLGNTLEDVKAAYEAEEEFKRFLISELAG